MQITHLSVVVTKPGIKAIEKLIAHESSHAHAAAVSQHLKAKSPVIVQMSAFHKQQQETARKSLLAVVKCSQYLARQGLAFRGHKQGEGNLDQLIKFSADMNEEHVIVDGTRDITGTEQSRKVCAFDTFRRIWCRRKRLLDSKQLMLKGRLL